MGLGGGLVKKVFCKNKSSIVNSHQERSFGLDKSKWTAVRLYLCGDELNSVIVENDSNSVKSCGVSVLQLQEDSGYEDICHVESIEEPETFILNAEESLRDNFSQDEEAAILIQSAFRGFMARRRYKDIERFDEVDGREVEDTSVVNEAASIEVLVDDSTENFSLFEENGAIKHQALSKSRTQIYRPKEEWDDSTLSGDTQRLRIQNKLEATTRRERALAYAFSQQLRTCTMRKKPNWLDSTNNEPNTSWSWLERWMATRVPENSNSCVADDYGSTDRRFASVIARKRLDISIEAKESCGSNDVPVIFEDDILHLENPKEGYGHVKNKFKATPNMLRRKTLPEYHQPIGSTKVNKRASYKDQEEKRQSISIKEHRRR